ncbi:hypothetical protein JB92DRAFT_3141090 [Gautieria morchelliformis]|nr:hypothetical protein JB92DRAFT_3141090 [Gautieria morchelliformis]
MARGRPPKCRRNITGLRNQGGEPSGTDLPNVEPPANHPSDGPSPSDQPDEDEGLQLHLDSTRVLMDNDEAGIESGSEVEEMSELGDWDDEELQEKMYMLAVNIGDDPSDEDWIPPELRPKKKVRIDRPKEYMKGPDVMSKSKCTQRRYRKADRGQQRLDAFAFTPKPKPVHISETNPTGEC